MEKTVIEGWIGKGAELTFIKGLLCLDIFRRKGKTSDWIEGDWPPIYVEVTIKEIKP